MSALHKRASILERFGLFTYADSLREQQKREYRKLCRFVAHGFRFALALKLSKGNAT